MIKIVIAEDNPNIRSALSKMLRKNSDIKVVGEAENGVEALDLIEQHHPDILLLDIEMPVMGGIEVVIELEGQDAPRIIILSSYTDSYIIEDLLAFGVCGYMVKEDAPNFLIDAVLQVHRNGENWFSSAIRPVTK